MNEIIPNIRKFLITPRSYLIRIVAGFIVLNLFVASLAILSIYRNRQQLERRVASQAQNLSQSLNLTISGIIDKSSESVYSVRLEAERELRGPGIDAGMLNSYIRNQKGRIPELDGLWATDASGNLLYGNRVDPDRIVDFSDRELFIQAKNNPQGDMIVGPPVLGRIGRQWIFFVGCRYSNPDGSFAGVVFGSLAIGDIQKLFSTFDVGRHGVMTLRYTDFSIMARYPDTLNQSSINSKIVSTQLAQLVREGHASGIYRNPGSIDPVERTFAFNRLKTYPLYVTVGLATDDYLASWQEESWQMAALAGLFMCGTLAASLLLYVNYRRKTASVELSEKYNFQHTLFEHNGAGNLIVSSTGTMLQVNEQFCEIFGYTADEFVGHSMEMIHVDRKDYEKWSVLVPEVSQGAGRFRMENSWRRKDGKVIWCIFSGVTIALGNHGSGIVWSVIDITQHKESEDALQAERQFLNDIIDFLPDATFVIDTEKRIVAWNRAAAALTGVSKEDMLGKGDQAYAAAFYGERRPVLIDMLDTTVTNNDDYLNMSRVGTALCAEAYCPCLHNGAGALLWSTASRLYDRQGNITGAIEVVRDVTEQKEIEKENSLLQAQLGQAQKMESIGRLAGGVAHDFNNLLTPIIGYAELLRNSMAHDSQNLNRIDKILNAADKARTLTQQLLSFSRKQLLDMKTIDLNSIITSFMDILRSAVREEIELSVHLTDDFLGIRGDKNQI